MQPNERAPHLIEDTTEDDLAVKYAERYFKRGRLAVINRIAKVAIVLELINMGGYKTPILVEELRLSRTEPALINVAEAPDGLTAETIVVGGTGIKNSVPIAEALSELGEIGSVIALDQDNKGIDAQVIAQMIIEKAKAQGVTEIGLWAESNSGFTIATIARIIQEDDSLLRVKFIAFDCLAPSVDTLRPDSKSAVEWVEGVSTVLPDAANHPLAIFAQQAFDNNGEPGTSQVSEADTPSRALLAAQTLLIVNNSLAEDLIAIAAVDNKQPPIIFSFRSPVDKVVDSDLAGAEFDEIITQTNLEHVDVIVPYISHANPTTNPGQYNNKIKSIMLPTIEAYEDQLNQPLTTSSTLKAFVNY